MFDEFDFFVLSESLLRLENFENELLWRFTNDDTASGFLLTGHIA